MAAFQGTPDSASKVDAVGEGRWTAVVTPLRYFRTVDTLAFSSLLQNSAGGHRDGPRPRLARGLRPDQGAVGLTVPRRQSR